MVVLQFGDKIVPDESMDVYYSFRSRAVPGSGTGGNRRGQGVPTWPLYDSFAGVPGLTPAKPRGLEAGGRGLTPAQRPGCL